MIPILKVREIITMPMITALPQLPDYVNGVTNLRGSVIPIVNLKKLLDAGGDNNSGSTVIVLATGKIVFGIVVDGITGVVNVDASKIEPPESFFNAHMDKIQGVAKFDDKLIVLLDAKKLLPLNDVSLLEDAIVDVKETGDGHNVEVTRQVQSIGGTVTVKELYDVKEFFGDKFDEDDPRQKVFQMMLDFMDALSTNNYEVVEKITSELVKETSSDLFKQVGKITRKLHDSLEDFKCSVDKGLDKLTRDDVPNALDKLEFVINKTEEAANKTMAVAERYFEESSDFSKHMKAIKNNEKASNYFKAFKQSMDNDMTEIITAQQFQDITGQTIRKVIDLVHNVEDELVRLITNFGMPLKVDTNTPADISGAGQSEQELTVRHSEQISQSDVESLLQEFGF
jgi:chemotaxis protein CheZ